MREAGYGSGPKPPLMENKSPNECMSNDLRGGRADNMQSQAQAQHRVKIMLPRISPRLTTNGIKLVAAFDRILNVASPSAPGQPTPLPPFSSC